MCAVCIHHVRPDNAHGSLDGHGHQEPGGHGPAGIDEESVKLTRDVVKKKKVKVQLNAGPLVQAEGEVQEQEIGNGEGTEVR